MDQIHLIKINTLCKVYKQSSVHLQVNIYIYIYIHRQTKMHFQI